MPFKQIKVKGGYKNKNMRTGKLHSNKPMTKEKADKGRMPNTDIK